MVFCIFHFCHVNGKIAILNLKLNLNLNLKQKPKKKIGKEKDAAIGGSLLLLSEIFFFPSLHDFRKSGHDMERNEAMLCKHFNCKHNLPLGIML